MQRLSRQSGLESRAVCLAAGWHRSGTDATATVVSQAGRWGITQVKDRLIKTAQSACRSTAVTGIRIGIVSATSQPATKSIAAAANFFPRRSPGRTEKTTCWAAADSDQRSVQQFSEDCHRVSKPAAVRGVEDPGAGRAAASTADCEVWSGQRKALRRATGVVGAGAGSQPCRGRGREPTRVAGLLQKNKAQASWAPDPAGGSSARGKARGLHAGAVPVRRLRGGDDGDRL